MSEKIIMYDSEEAASIKIVTGWVASDGSFWGDDEDMARYSGSTHRKCKNNPEHPIVRRNDYCSICREEKNNEEFNAMERKEWDRETPIAIFNTDQYFWDEYDLLEYCNENNISPKELRLVICEPNYPAEIDGEDYFCDDLPPDGELPSELQGAFEILNIAIRNCGPLSWSQGNISAIIGDEVNNEKR
ncbi:hypothetical protein [Photorhabdus namnaonensis]|uniref:Uncharacterized protein n=1 Tax=Photorhabdus namnaonensis TaxID=1851568 RepID=A0A1B8YJA4_9GAMM|nr:hypothetical protein [Photorhabdus namnaonensis]OCA55176.1 hypothetical protein Phpb_01794 [Photorhabdus namnaonensis]